MTEIKMNDINDDEIRVIGEDSDMDEGKKRIPWWVWVVIGVAAAGIAMLVLHQKPESDKDPVDENTSLTAETSVEAEEADIWIENNDPSLPSATIIQDTLVDSLHLQIHTPYNCTPELHVGPMEHTDPDIVLAAMAADWRSDNGKIVGAYVLAGEPLSWGVSKKGYCAIIDGEMTIGTSENSPLFEKATETGGYFFRQFPLVDNGQLVENEQKNKSVRKALCSRAGQIFIAVTESDESYHDFSQALVDLGIDNAISLVGSRYAFGWWIDQDGVKISFSDVWHQYEMENYVIWKVYSID